MMMMMMLGSWHDGIGSFGGEAFWFYYLFGEQTLPCHQVLRAPRSLALLILGAQSIFVLLCVVLVSGKNCIRAKLNYKEDVSVCLCVSVAQSIAAAC